VHYPLDDPKNQRLQLPASLATAGKLKTASRSKRSASCPAEQTHARCTLLINFYAIQLNRWLLPGSD
jgi:hypothetical protein